MNTLEIKFNHKINTWSDFIKTAKQQFINYEKLEGRNWNKYDFSIDCAEDQMLFKDMLQIRCIEELTEASIAFKNDEKEHFYEEITDALNFLLSGYIMAGLNMPEKDLKDYFPDRLYYLDQLDIPHWFYIIIEDIGNLCNLLKNRPWAQSNYLVSLLDLEDRANKLWNDFWLLLSTLGLNNEKIYELFERKYEVNKWRIKTGY